MTSDPRHRLAPVVRIAPAKLNLTLAVLGRRPDGLHDLHSVAVPLALADRLSLAPLAGPSDTLHVRGFDAGPTERNLVLRAIAATRAAVGRASDPFPLASRLDKRIPVSAGLGGGSSDAAAALDAALEAWGTDLALADRAAVAARLGSDVPFFLAGGPAALEGRGERVTPLRGIAGRPPAVLLVTPGLAVATADVFAALDAGGAARPPAAAATRLTSVHLAAEMGTGLRAGDLVARAGVLAVANDLAAATAVLVPTIVPFRRGLGRLLGRPVGQSGSGPTLWALYPSLDEAEAAASAVRDAIAAGRLAIPGRKSPSIVATTILGGQPSGGPGGPDEAQEDEHR
jgi:4-diphosphocytidyl-2-C-methyl-D-erythritol kinase